METESMKIRLKKSFLFIVLTVFVLGACQGSRFYPIEDLLIDESAFPPDWQRDPDGPAPDPSAPFGGIKSVERTTLNFNSTTASAFETIERFKNSKKAHDDFNSQRNFLFKGTEFQGPYEIPDELPYESDVADRYHFACWQPDYTLMRGCSYLAQYGSYLVQFHLGWDPDALTPLELENVLRAIDEKLAPYATK
jgi:hypothetical protein